MALSSTVRSDHLISRIRAFGAAIALPFCTAANATETLSQEPVFAVSGFGTVGLARSTDPNAAFQRDASLPKGIDKNWSGRADSLLGLQASYRWNDTVRAVVQGVSHYRYDSTYSPEVTWGFVKYDPSPLVSFRVGRIGTEFLMQSDSRMVGYSYLPVRPNADFFGVVPINYIDGADAKIRVPIGSGLWAAGLTTGIGREKTPGTDFGGSKVIEGMLAYSLDFWHVQYMYSRARLGRNVGALDSLRTALSTFGADSAASALGNAGNVTRYQSIGATYDDGAWQVQVATNRIDGNSILEDSRSSYFQVGRRLGSLTPFAGYSVGKSSTKTFDLGLIPVIAPALNSAWTAVKQQSHQDRRTTTLGARWDVARNMDLKAQVDSVRGDPSSVYLYQNVQTGWDGRTTLLSLTLDFIF